MATSVTDFNKRNPNYIGNRAAYIKPEDVAERLKYQTKKSSGKKGSGRLGKSGLSAWISELAGAGGAVGGAATGAALGSVVPGIGNIVGGIAGGVIGGFGGGFGGRLAENQLRDNEMRVGDALKEGAWSGAFGGVGPAWQGARGAYAAGKAAGFGGKGLVNTIKAGSGVIDDAIATAGKVGGKSASAKLGMQAMKSGGKTGKVLGQNSDSLAKYLSNLDEVSYAGRQGLSALGGAGRNYNRNTVVTGYKGLNPAEKRQVSAALDGVNKWFSGIGKSGQFENLDDAIMATTKQYSRLPEAKQAFQYGDDIVKSITKEVYKNPSIRNNLDEGVKNVNKTTLNSIIDDVRNFKTNDDFFKYMSGVVNKRYKDLSNATTLGSKETQIYEAVRRAMKSTLDDKLVSKSGANKQVANLMNAKELLQDAITRDTSAGVGQGGTLGRLLTNVAGPTADVLGRGAQQAGKVTKYTTPIIAGGLARGVANQAMAPVQEMPGVEQLDMNNPEDVMLYNEMNAAPTSVAQEDMSQMGGMEETMPAYTLEQAMADISRDPKNAAQYKWVYEQSQKSGEGAQLSAAEKKSQKQAQTAMQGLTQLRQLFASAGGGQNRLPGILGNVQGMVGANSKADSYNKIRDSLTTSLARAFGETGVLTDQDREVYKQALPRLEDTPEEAAIKLQYLEDMLSGSSQSYETDYGTQADLSSIISQYGAQ